MKFEWLSREIEKEGFKVMGITFLEDGYEVRIRPKDAANCYEANSILSENMKKLDAINYKGLLLIETSVQNGRCTILLVPKSMDEMTDFIWKYVEKYGSKTEILLDILSDAFSVLGKAIERIPDECGKDKEEALNNYNSFTNMIF